MGENGYEYLLINPNRSYGICVCASHQHEGVTENRQSLKAPESSHGCGINPTGIAGRYNNCRVVVRWRGYTGATLHLPMYISRWQPYAERWLPIHCRLWNVSFWWPILDKSKPLWYQTKLSNPITIKEDATQWHPLWLLSVMLFIQQRELNGQRYHNVWDTGWWRVSWYYWSR